MSGRKAFESGQFSTAAIAVGEKQHDLTTYRLGSIKLVVLSFDTALPFFEIRWSHSDVKGMKNVTMPLCPNACASHVALVVDAVSISNQPQPRELDCKLERFYRSQKNGGVLLIKDVRARHAAIQAIENSWSVVAGSRSSPTQRVTRKTSETASASSATWGTPK